MNKEISSFFMNLNKEHAEDKWLKMAKGWRKFLFNLHSIYYLHWFWVTKTRFQRPSPLLDKSFASSLDSKCEFCNGWLVTYLYYIHSYVLSHLFIVYIRLYMYFIKLIIHKIFILFFSFSCNLYWWTGRQSIGCCCWKWFVGKHYYFFNWWSWLDFRGKSSKCLKKDYKNEIWIYLS